MTETADICSAKIVSVIGTPVQRITLEIPPANNYTFLAGQYLEILTPDHVIPMSIASAPWRLPLLELHFRANPGAPEALALTQLLEGKQSLSITPAKGDVGCGKPDQPLLIVAGGSGAAQAFSCTEERQKLFERGITVSPTTIVWCADKDSDIYAADELSRFEHVTLHTHIDDRRTPENEGLTWLSQHASDYIDAYVVICGSPGFVSSVTDLLIAKGITRSQLHSDMYAFM